MRFQLGLEGQLGRGPECIAEGGEGILAGGIGREDPVSQGRRSGGPLTGGRGWGRHAPLPLAGWVDVQRALPQTPTPTSQATCCQVSLHCQASHMTTVNHRQHVRGREKGVGDSEREKETSSRGTGQVHFLPGPREYLREAPQPGARAQTLGPHPDSAPS